MVDYTPLSNSAFVGHTVPLPTTAYTNASPPFGTILVPNLNPGTVYRLTVRFARNDAGGKPLHHEWCSEFYNVVQMTNSTRSTR